MNIRYRPILTLFFAIAVSYPVMAEEVATGEQLTFKDNIPDIESTWPTWIEGRDGAVLMAYYADGKVQITESTDGGHTWTVVSHADHSSSYPYMTWLRDGRLVMIVESVSKDGSNEFHWISSNDVGRTWSKPHLILAGVSNAFPFGPIIEMEDGRWAYCPYRQTEEKEFQALLTWSEDQGETWSKPIVFPTPTDGNHGLTEVTVAQTGPAQYVAAIRADEGADDKKFWDGFYLSYSTDGLSWSAPESTGDIGRMPLFYRIGKWWVLTYRQYAPTEGASYGAYRISLDGKNWSEPHRVGKNVNNAPFLVRVGNELVAFNHEYPDRKQLTRHVIQLPDEAPQHLRDILWVWGNPGLEKPGEHGVATFVEASSTRRAELLGVPNIAMCGMGLPNDDAKAETLTKEVSDAPRLIWETTPDGEGIGPPFVYEKRMAQIRNLAKRYPQIEGVLLDDMSTGKINRGFRAEHVRHIREQLGEQHKSVKIWGVVYTMSLGREHLAECIRECDVINLWMWDAKDTANFGKYVTRLENDHPDKPIVLGIYLRDYGGNDRMPLDLLEQQCELARKLAHAGRIEGIVFLTIDNDAEAVQWTADWVAKFGDEELGSPTK